MSNSSAASSLHQAEAGPSEPAPSPWLRAIDNTYTLFEHDQHRQTYGTLSEKVKDAVRLCEDVVQEVGIRHCALSFNGGKDCTVLVHILSAVLRRLRQRRKGDAEQSLPCIPALYITCSSPFDEVEMFVIESIRRYNLRLVRQEGGMKDGLEKYLNGVGQEEAFAHSAINAGETGQAQKRDVKAIFVGTRRTDPHGAELTPRKKTDPGWPDVERIQPILDWSYDDVWQFLRCPLLSVEEDQMTKDERGLIWGATYGVPYCTLYDQGYTSLGSTYNTFPNPTLDTRKGQRIGEQDQQQGRWLPAYRLQDESLERAGRGERPPST